MNSKLGFGEIFGRMLAAAGNNLASEPVWRGVLAANNDKETIRAERRRRPGPTDSGQRERAAAPERSRPGGSSGSGGSGGTPRPPVFSGGQFPGGRGKPSLLMVGIVLILFLCIVPLMMFFGPGDSGEVSQPEAGNPVAAAPTVTRVPTKPAPPAVSTKPVTPRPPAKEGQTWTVMLYQDADDKILEEDIYVDLNEAERVGSSERVNIVAQVDRYQAGYRGDGNWSSAKRFYVTRDNDLQRVASQQVADLGEVNMSAGSTLVDFVTWAAANFPADNYVLIMSDHGMGWPGGWSDPEPGGRGDRSIPLAAALGDELYLMEIDDALGQIRAEAGIDKFELIGMDACLMGHLEVFSALAPHARYAVASQEIEPALGWAYTGFLQALTDNPDMDGASLSRTIVQSYIQDDQRIVDDEARAEFAGRGSPLGGLFGGLGGPSADQLRRELGQNITLTAVDLAAMPALMDSFNNLAFSLQDANQRAVAQARNYAQSFTSVFGSNIPPSYIDLGNFVQILRQEAGSPSVAQAADEVLAALDQAVIAEKHGPKKPGASGVSIYFPNSQLYASPVTGPESYTAIARRFAAESLWDDFLAYHYTGRAFEPAAQTSVVPDRSTTISAPGAGPIQVAPLMLSNSVAAPGQPVLLSTDITGNNVGYVYLFVGFYDQASNAIFVADSDYLESATSREIDGVYYPVWSDRGEFTLEFEWEPVVFAINDGQNSVVAHFEPQTYGASFEEAIYTVEGIYTYADGGETRYARLFFNNGQLRQVFGFTGDDGNGAPREIIPQPGDTFTVLEKWLDLDQQGNVTQTARQPGGTLTFSDQMFTWETLDAAAGEYLVGFIVEDLDGNANEVYQPVTVR